MIVTINMIDDQKEKLLAVCNITIDPGDISEKQILQAYSVALMMQNVTMGHLQMSLRKHLRKYVGNIRR